jgi:exodeoxyribonuclease-5
MDEIHIFDEEPVGTGTPVSYTFSEDQQAAYDWLILFCKGLTSFRKVLLQGYAGTGKTFLLNRVIEAILHLKLRVGMTAPTHKAVRVLRKFSEFPDKILFGTIHSFLGLKEYVDTRTGKVSFKPDFESGRQRKIDFTDILIVDESSMLPDELFEHIEDEQRSNRNLVVIYAGDELQIPPVRDKEDRKEYRDAIPFIESRRQAHKIHLLELITPQRQSAESPIIIYAHTIREHITHLRIPFNYYVPEFKNALEVLPRNRGVLEETLKLFLSDEFKKDPDFVKVIAWRNDTVNYFNQWIRNMLHGLPQEASLPYVLPGDLLVMDEPVIRDSNVVLANNEEIVVKSAILESRELRYTLPGHFSGAPRCQVFHHSVWKTVVQDEGGMLHVIEILDPAFLPEYNAMRKSIATVASSTYDQGEKDKLWKLYFAIPKRFGWVKYNYALTIHKAQGSTYDNTISMEWDIDINRNVEECNRIRYVAATRSRHKLFIVK